MTASERKFELAERYAHRGYHDKPRIPENSMAAFRRAVEYGLGSEFDVHMIADGSLVVFHDDDLERQTGVKGSVEAYDISNLRKLRLEGTDEAIPTFDEVLGLYEDTGLPLLIELKPVGGNHRRLAEAVCRRLGSYKGRFVLESFDPRAMMAVRKIRPDFIRGQLVQDFFKSPENLPMYQVALLANLAFNALVKPDFIAFRIGDKRRTAVRHAVEKAGRPEFTWTVTTADDYRKTVAAGRVPIFEQIEPEELKRLIDEDKVKRK